MADQMDDDMEAMILETAAIQRKRQDTRAASEGELQLRGVFKHYLNYDTQLKKNVEDTAPPASIVMKPTLKDPKKKYPAKLTMHATALSFTCVDKQCELLPNDEDGWRLFAKITYNKDEKENVKQWLTDNYKKFYANDGSYTSKFPLGEYVDKDGNFADYKWIKIHRKSLIKVKVDDREDSIFRRRVGGKSGPLVVGPFTLITFSRCSVEQFVSLRKESEDSTEYAPQGYTSIVAKSVDLNEDHDPLMPFTQRLHQQEDKDVHNMIPVSRLAAGEHVPYTVYFWVCNKYQSPQPCPTGISISRLPDTPNLSEYLFETKDKQEPKIMLRFSLFQWTGDSGTNREMYSVKILVREKEKDLWKNFGILDPKHYAHIMMTCSNIPCHVSAEIWRDSILKFEFNSPEKLNNKKELNMLRGFYFYGAKMIIPDFITYYKKGWAHRVSLKRVEREFERFSSTSRATGETEITLKPLGDAKENPLNGKNAALAPVFSIGNGQVEDPTAKKSEGLYHAFDGDLCDVSGDSVFFVLTSRKMEYSDLVLVQDEQQGDAFLDKIIEEEKVYYWFFGIRKKYVSNAALIQEMKKPPTTITSSKTTKRPTEEEDPEDHVSMEKEEDDSAPPPPPSSAKKGKKTAPAKKK